MGKSEPTPQRFRRKAKSPSSSSDASERISNSLVSSTSAVDNLLCDTLLDTSELAVPSPSLTSQLSQSLTTANGTCDVQLTDGGAKGSSPTLVRDNGVAGPADSTPHKDPDRPKDLCLSSHLPAELAGLSHSEITPLCSDQSLDLSVCHVQKEAYLALVIFMYNSSSSDIQQILLEVDSDELEVQQLLSRNLFMTSLTHIIHIKACFLSMLLSGVLCV